MINFAQQSEQANFDPNRLLNALIERHHLKNDAALCRALGVEAPMISKIRHRRLQMSAGMLIRIHEEFGLSLRELREAMGDRRQKYRVGDVATNPIK